MTDEKDITGKQLLDEFEGLLCDTGAYLYKVGKRIYVGVKNAVKKSDASEGGDGQQDAPQADIDISDIKNARTPKVPE